MRDRPRSEGSGRQSVEADRPPVEAEGPEPDVDPEPDVEAEPDDAGLPYALSFTAVPFFSARAVICELTVLFPPARSPVPPPSRMQRNSSLCTSSLSPVRVMAVSEPVKPSREMTGFPVLAISCAAPCGPGTAGSHLAPSRCFSGQEARALLVVPPMPPPPKPPAWR